MTKAILRDKIMNKEWHFIQEGNKYMIRELQFDVGSVPVSDVTSKWDKEAANAHYLRLIKNERIERVQ